MKLNEVLKDVIDSDDSAHADLSNSKFNVSLLISGEELMDMLDNEGPKFSEEVWDEIEKKCHFEHYWLDKTRYFIRVSGKNDSDVEAAVKLIKSHFKILKISYGHKAPNENVSKW